MSDVPYGLGNKEPKPEEILAYLQGSALKTGDFMGNDWDIPSVEVWKEAYRVLKPGAYLVSFGGARTFDLISLGIRMAGFECRDSIADNYTVELPNLQWVTSQGMPKSSNIALNVDKALGHKRSALEEVVTEEAQSWSGYGSGLKPCWEPILVFRKPFKGTLAKNVLEHGTGALNIDASRVKHANKADFEAHKAQVEAIRSKGGVRGNSWKNDSDLSGANEVTTDGRWPANLVFTHSSDCQIVGSQEVRGKQLAAGTIGGYQGSKDGHYVKGTGAQFAESVVEPVWACVEGCPVKALDEQSGERPSMLTGRANPNVTHTHPGTEMNPNSTFLGERTHHSRVYADTGGASRFFAQFDGVPFRYVPKASRKEAGCGEFEVRHPTVKPLKLMRYLVKLVTPPGGTVLDPYCGSGSTLHAAVLEGFNYLGIERDPENYAEAKRRMAIVLDRAEAQDAFNELMGIV